MKQTKQIGKKALSILLAIAMLLPGICFFSLPEAFASVTDTASPAFYFGVPETIYLKPTTGTMNAFQYYVNNTFSGTSYTKDASATATTGKFWFKCADCTSVKIEVSSVSAFSTTLGGSVSGGTYSVTATPSSGLVSGTINSGTISSALSQASVSTLTWKFTYTLKDGNTTVTETAYAYTVVYAPCTKVIAAAARAVNTK